MGRLLPSVLVAALVLWIANSRIAGQQSVQPDFSETAILRATTLEELRRWDPLITEGARSGALRIRSVIVDPLIPTRLVERYEQFHNGVRIWGADVVRDSERGVPHAIFGQLAPADIQIPAAPGVGGDDARAVLLQLGGREARLLTDLELVIRRLDSGDYRLAYTAVVSGNNDVVRIFIDAVTGDELLRFTEIKTQAAAVGSGQGVLGDQKKLSVESSAGGYLAFDRHRPPMIQTFDMRGDLARSIRVLIQGFPLLRSELAIDTDNNWTDPSVIDAHAHVSWTYDYYYKRFQRNGLDGRNGPVNIVTNALSQTAALQYAPDSEVVGQFVLQASWCRDCNGGTGVMFFGNGIPPGFSLPGNGTNWTYTSGALDVAAHELTHAVTDFTSRLEYRRESGALNEAFSDMMGKSVEFYYHPPGGAPGQADYVLGKDVVRAARPGALSGIRSMANPQAFSQPDHWSAYRRLPDSADNGGVHINSGIPNHAFYLAIEGGTNRTSGQSVQGVGGTNREQIERVFYRAFTLLTPSSANFSMARIATIQSARDSVRRRRRCRARRHAGVGRGWCDKYVLFGISRHAVADTRRERTGRRGTRFLLHSGLDDRDRSLSGCSQLDRRNHQSRPDDCARRLFFVLLHVGACLWSDDATRHYLPRRPLRRTVQRDDSELQLQGHRSPSDSND